MFTYANHIGLYSEQIGLRALGEITQSDSGVSGLGGFRV
jgi:hypothetical protein